MNSVARYIVPREAFKYLLIIFIILTSLKFYSIMIPFGGGKYVIFMGALVIIFFLFLNIIYDRSKKFLMHFKTEAWLMTIPLLFSIFSAYYFHNQSVTSTIIGQHGVYFILLYFLLHQLKPHPDVLLRIFLWLGYVFCILYIIQYFAYPFQFIQSQMRWDRGTLRIFMPGSEYLFTSYFILLGRFFMTKNLKYIVWMIPFIIVLLLMGTRQMIGSLVLASLINIMLSKTIKSKLVMYLLIAACLVPFYFIFQNIFNEMFQVTAEQQSAGITESIRYQAVLYYLFQYNTNPLWMIFGNGMPDILSDYGQSLTSLGIHSGLFLEDIGLFGDFFRFGILLVIAKLSLYIRLLKWRLNEKYTFVRYNMITIVLTLFTGGGVNASVLSLVCMMMYIADLNNVEFPLDPDNIKKRIKLGRA